MAMKDSNENDSLTDNKFVTFYNYPEVTSNYNQEVVNGFCSYRKVSIN